MAFTVIFSTLPGVSYSIIVPLSITMTLSLSITVFNLWAMVKTVKKSFNEKNLGGLKSLLAF